MITRVERLASAIWPELRELPPERRILTAVDVVGAVYFALISLAGLVWLGSLSDWSRLLDDWPLLLLLGLLLIPFNRYRFFTLTELSPGKTSTVSSSMDVVVDWTAALLFGPVGLWLGILSTLLRLVTAMRGENLGSSWWGTLRNELSNLAENTVPRLAALFFYQQMGGILPVAGLDLRSVLVGFVATIFMFVFQQMMVAPVYFLIVIAVRSVDQSISSLRMLVFFVVNSAILASATPFALLAAGLYLEYGLWMLIFFFGGLVVVSYLAYRSSRMALLSQQQSRLMEGLEKLSREMLLAPPDEEVLLNLITSHLATSQVYLPGQLEVRLFPEHVLIHMPRTWSDVPEAAWEWLRATPGTHHYRPGLALPWGDDNQERCTALVSIDNHDNGQTIGGIYHSVSTRGLIDTELYRMYLPALDALADQVALALRRVENYRNLVAHQRVEQELRLAGDIQGSFLPDHFPEVAGWGLSAVLVSARDTSGDFFDFFRVQEGKVGIVLADVADKGIGAALYMALSRAYLRSQAIEKDPNPPNALAALNRRILEDTSSDLFVTLVYGIIAPGQDEFIYCNAGHPPPIVVWADATKPLAFLTRTGMAVGVLDETNWQPARVKLAPGDFILIYSDGVTDARNAKEEVFGLDRLIAEAESMRGRPPAEVRHYLMEQVQEFYGNVQEDDVTLLILGKTE